MSALPVDPHLYSTFLGVMAVMAVTPGPANLFAVATGVEKGRASALVGVLGMNAATLVWFGAAALGLGRPGQGLSRRLQGRGRPGRGLCRLAGDQGVARRLRHRRPARSCRGSPGPQRPGRRVSRVQIANPKAILFFTAVLPPFVDVSRPVAPQMALFAVAAIGMDMMSMSAYALSGAALSRRMQQPRFRKGFGVFVGVLLMTAAALIVARL